MNLPLLLSWIMLTTLVAQFSCKRLENEFELAKGTTKDNHLDDLNEIPELTTTQSVTEEDVTLQGKKVYCGSNMGQWPNFGFRGFGLGLLSLF